MENNQSHRDILEQCLSGQKPRRLPISLWRHFPGDDQFPESLAAATVNFQETFDFDFVKVTPASSFCIRDWGAVDVWKGSPEGTRDYQEPVIKNPDDWASMKVLDPKKGTLGGQIECLKLIKKSLKPDVPIIQTIFSPLSQAKNLVGKNNLSAHLRNSPELFLEGLKTITQTTIEFIEQCKKIKIDGIFYAVQHASFDLLSKQEFLDFGKTYDLQILENTRNFWLNIAHIHGENLIFDAISDYPVHALNWHDRHTPPGLRTARSQYKGILCGGLKRWETMTLGTPDDIQQEAQDAVLQTEGIRFILGTGCVLPIVTPYGNILKTRNFVDNIIF